MKKKILAGVAALVLTGSAVLGYSAFQKSAQPSADEIYKEVTVQRGNVTAGVTESAAVSVESLEQTYDLTLTSTSVSASVESSSSGSSRGSGMSMGSGMGSMGSTSVSTQSESSAVALVVEQVCITEGQTVQKGDVLMTITQESIDEARTALTEAVEDAELALRQAQIEENETRLSAQYDYDTRMTEGKNALAVYNATMNEIAQHISDLETQIAEYTDDKQLASLRSQLSSAKSSRTADELAARQAYEEALMYYENAQDLYDVSVNDVGASSKEAQEAVIR